MLRCPSAGDSQYVRRQVEGVHVRAHARQPDRVVAKAQPGTSTRLPGNLLAEEDRIDGPIGVPPSATLIADNAQRDRLVGDRCALGGMLLMVTSSRRWRVVSGPRFP